MKLIVTSFVLLMVPGMVLGADAGLEAITVATGDNGETTYSVTLQVLLLMTLLTFLPAGLLMMTSFTRIVIVLAILRQALGTNSTPSNQTLIGLALFLTFFIMAPVFDQVYRDAVKPYMEEKVNIMTALEAAGNPLRNFMMNQIRDADLMMFGSIAGYADLNAPEEVPFSVLVPAFITSELKTGFQMGFLIFLPFLIIDIVVASVLMAMGMMMLSPMIISLPFKIMMFVLVDGWSMIMGTLASSFYV